MILHPPYDPNEEVRKKLGRCIVLMLAIGMIVYLLSSCQHKEENALKEKYFKGMAVYRTSVQIYQSEMNQSVDIQKIDSIYIENLSKNNNL